MIFISDNEFRNIDPNICPFAEGIIRSRFFKARMSTDLCIEL